MSISSYSIRPKLTSSQRQELNTFSDVMAHLLFYRGITNNQTGQKFIEPNYDRDIHDPFLLKDAEKAALRIIQSVESNEKIAIYSDYDADGIPGAVMFADFFNKINFKNFIVYIPHRHDEGFGVHVAAVEELANQGVKLIITIDCGITDFAAVTCACEKNIDVIITDHHEPPPVLPPAFAIVNHKQKNCLYPDKNLCGSGTAYKLVQAILSKNRFDLKDGQEKWLLDMVGIATLSDMVPLTGENRVLAYYGLTVLRKSPRKGLMRLLSKLSISQKNLTEDDIAFMITPRINAASRMGVPMDAFNLLSTEDENEAYSHVAHIEEINNERKGVVASLVKEVKKNIKERHGGKVPQVIVLGNPSWRPSLLGLVANSCAEEFDRPVFLWGRDGDDVIKGSCRSEGKTNIVELMRKVPSGVFTHFGGHQHSGGFAVSNEEIHFLEKYLNEANDFVLNNKDQQNIEESKLIVDMELSLNNVDWRLQEEISKLAPFGTGNSKPVFLFKKVSPTSIRHFGKSKDHIELVFKKDNGNKISAIAFFGATENWAKLIMENTPIDLLASIEKSYFAGKTELRLRVVDVC